MKAIHTKSALAPGLVAVITLALVFGSHAGPAACAPVHLSVGGGMTVPTSDASDAFDSGFNLRGMVEMTPPGFPVELRGTLGYDKMDMKFADPMTQSGSAAFTQLLGGATVGMWMGPVRPYVGLDLGAFFVKAQSELGGVETSDSNTSFGMDGALGMQARLGPVGAFVEARILNVFTDQGYNPAALNLENTQSIPVTFGVRLF